MLTFGSLFAGVGGFDIGLEKAGWQCKWQVEWDAHCQQTLSYHWPDIPKYWDVSEVSGYELFPVDVITFGSPCQDLSVAGKRAGLEGGRSGLFFEAIRIIKEMQHATGGAFPRWAIWENVVGALSSRNGDDFEAVLKEMAGLGSDFVEWAVLDAQFFGVPQRRRRVFVVAGINPPESARSAGQILAVGESRRGNSPKGKSARKGATGTTTESPGISSVSAAVTSKLAKGTGGPAGDETQNLVLPDIFVMDRAAFNQGENAKYPALIEQSETMPTIVARGPHAVGYSAEIAPTLRSGGDGGVPSSRGEHLVVHGDIHSFDTLFGSNAGVYENMAPPLKATQGPPSISANIQDPMVLDGTRVDDVRVYQDGMTPTLKNRMGTGGNNVPFLAIPIQDGRELEKHQNGMGIAEEGSPAYTLDQTGAQAVAYSIREDAKANNFSATEIQTARALQSLQPSVQSHHAQTFIASPMTVRRLTPTECERLMGWPDNHTLNRADGKTNSDTTRYKMCGNGVASPVAQWIATRINFTY